MATLVVGLLGCGVVGGGVAERLLSEPVFGDTRLHLGRVLVRDLAKDRFPSASLLRLTTSPSEVLDDPDCSIIVECIGGVHPAFGYVESALRSGKHVVTANKALVAEHGRYLAALAAQNGVAFRYEASVGGAIPIVRTLRHLAGVDEISEITGVLNGTTNFILTAMEEGATFDDAVHAAQDEGYAESDPSYDLDGIDSAQKLAILAAVAFGKWPEWSTIERQSIRSVRQSDLTLAKRLGCRLKLVGRAYPVGDRVNASVTLKVVSLDHPFAVAHGPQNVVRVVARHAGPLSLTGVGAGRSPTASAILSDVADIVAHRADPCRGAASSTPTPELVPAKRHKEHEDA